MNGVAQIVGVSMILLLMGNSLRMQLSAYKIIREREAGDNNRDVKSIYMSLIHWQWVLSAIIALAIF